MPAFLPMVLALMAAPPVAVFWASAPVAPGQVAMLCGTFPTPEELSVLAYREHDDGGSQPPGRSYPPRAGSYAFAAAKMLQASDTALKLELPTQGGPGVYDLQVARRSPGGVKPFATVRLNAADPWWILGDAGRSPDTSGATAPATVYVTRGGWVRITGRCLMLTDRKPRVVFLPPSGPAVDLTLIETSPWHILARLPQSLKPGASGTLAVYNGSGDSLAWGTVPAYRLLVVPRTDLPTQLYDLDKPLPQVSTFSVTSFGATGGGTIDDTNALQAALLAASKAPGVAIVTLSRGRFPIREPLKIPPHTLLRGAGEELTSIAIPDTDKPPNAWIEGSHHFAIADLTLYASNHVHGIAGDMSGDPAKSGHVSLRHVRVRADMFRGHMDPAQVDARFRAGQQVSTGGGDTVRFSGPDVQVTDCDLYGSGRSIYFYHVLGGLVANTHLYNGRWGWYNFNVCQDVVLDHDIFTGADLMSTGGGFAAFGPERRSENMYVAHGRWEAMNGWDREAFTSDAGGGAYNGAIASASFADGRLTIDLAADADVYGGRWEGALFAIYKGRARGFVGRILSLEKRRAVVEPLLDAHTANASLDWPSLFDATSRATITQMQRHYTFVGNDFSDAGIGIQYFGTAIEHITADNSCSRAGGFHGWALDYDGLQPVVDCQWFGNKVLEGNSPGTSHVAIMAQTPAVAFNSVFRGNRLFSNAQLEVLSNGDPTLVENVLLEGNTVEHSDVGLRVVGGLGIFYRNNRFFDCAKPVYDVAAERARWRDAIARAASAHDPIAWWSFDGKARSSIGLDLPLALNGTTSFADGVRGKALSLDGAGYAECSTEAACVALNLPSLTITAWVKPAKLPGRWGIVAKRNGGMGTPFVVSLTSGALGFEATTDEGKWDVYNFPGPAVMRPDVWQHVAVTVDGGKHEALYVDGKLVAERDIAPRPLGTNESPVRIGWEAWGGDPPRGETPAFFHGLIDEVKIWARPLTAAEIAVDAAR